MKKFLGLNILMGQVRNGSIDDYWSTGRRFTIESVIEYFFGKFGTVYTSKQNLSLDEAMIPHRGRLSFQVYNQ